MAELFTEIYNHLPLAHCLSDRVLVRLDSTFGPLSSLIDVF